MPKQQNKILFAEDDLNLGDLLKDYLQAEGFYVELCKDGENALEAFKAKRFDLCLLDVMMPKMDGFTLAKTIRAIDKTIPIIFITARSLKNDKIKGYDLEADDYITKPFDEEELVMKIRAIMRRSKLNKIGNNNEEIFQVGKYVFDVTNQSLSINSDVKRITERECELIKYLFDRRNKLIKREDLLKDLWGENDYFLGRSLDVFITKIRKLFKEDPGLSIENVFKVGFVFNVPEK